MKINFEIFKSKKVWIPAVVAFVLVLGIVGFFIYRHYNNPKTSANSATKSEESVGQVQEIEGTLEFSKPGQDWKAALLNDKVFKDTVFRTSENSRSLIKLNTNDEISLSSGSQLSVDKVLTDEVDLTQISGQSYHKVAEPKHKYVVTNGTVTATAMGTEFLFEINGDDVNVLVYKSSVLVETKDGGKEEVKESNKAKVNRNDKKIQVQKMNEGDQGYKNYFYPERTDGQTVDPEKTATGSYPKIDRISDNLGHSNTKSIAKGNLSTVDGGTVHVGDKINIKTDASDPDKGKLSYIFWVQPSGGGFETRQDWSDKNSFTWTVSAHDVGENVLVIPAIKDDDKALRFGNSDDYAYMSYRVLPAGVNNDIYPTITSMTDSLGRTITGSAGKSNLNGGSGVEVRVGDSITFNVTATDPNNDPISYSFYVQPSGGGFETRQDWGGSNSFTWNVTAHDVGEHVLVMPAIKDNDSYLRFGSYDDYGYLSYNVLPAGVTGDIYPVIGSVVDSVGRTNTGSVGKNSLNGMSDAVVKVGDKITFTVSASDPNGDPVSYAFYVQPSGGGFELKQGWSSNNAFEWTVTSHEIGQHVLVISEVKDNDQYLRFGSADDYGYMTFTVVE